MRERLLKTQSRVSLLSPVEISSEKKWRGLTEELGRRGLFTVRNDKEAAAIRYEETSSCDKKTSPKLHIRRDSFLTNLAFNSETKTINFKDS